MSKITYKNSIKIITINNEKYVYKLKKENNKNIYNYLKKNNFLNFLEPIDENEKYEIFEYIEQDQIPTQHIYKELIYLMSLLHIKTTTYNKISLEKTNKIYNENKEKITYLQNYYFDLQDYLETKEVPSPAALLLLKNISKFHKLLKLAINKLEEWYIEKQKNTKERITYIHNNLSIDHILKKDKYYLISWEKSRKDLVIYDFINFYKNDFNKIDMFSLFEQYQQKYTFMKDEMLLFESLISIPDKILFNKNNFVNIIEVCAQIDYVEKTTDFILKNNEKN